MNTWSHLLEHFVMVCNVYQLSNKHLIFMTFVFFIGRPRKKTKNARNFANVGRIGWKERHTIYQINPRPFQHIIKKIQSIFKMT